jgi:hypothetical protein
VLGQLALIAAIFLGMSVLVRRDGMSFGDRTGNTVVTIARPRHDPTG